MENYQNNLQTYILPYYQAGSAKNASTPKITLTGKHKPGKKDVYYWYQKRILALESNS